MSKQVKENNLITISIEVETELYDKASEVCAKYGLTVEEATVLFLEHIVREGVPQWLEGAAAGYKKIIKSFSICVNISNNKRLAILILHVILVRIFSWRQFSNNPLKTT